MLLRRLEQLVDQFIQKKVVWTGFLVPMRRRHDISGWLSHSVFRSKLRIASSDFGYKAVFPRGTNANCPQQALSGCTDRRLGRSIEALWSREVLEWHGDQS